MIDFVHLNEQRVDDVMMEDLEVLVSHPVLDISLLAREEIIRDEHLVPLQH